MRGHVNTWSMGVSLAENPSRGLGATLVGTAVLVALFMSACGGRGGRGGGSMPTSSSSTLLTIVGSVRSVSNQRTLTRCSVALDGNTVASSSSPAAAECVVQVQVSDVVRGAHTVTITVVSQTVQRATYDFFGDYGLVDLNTAATEAGALGDQVLNVASGGGATWRVTL